VRIMTSKLHHNAQKVEEKLEKITISEAQKSKGPYFITTKGEAGYLPGRDHVDMVNDFSAELEIESSSGGIDIYTLDDFLEKTEMIRIRFDSNTANLTIRTIPNKNQIKSLDQLKNIVSDIEYRYKFKNIKFETETKSFADFLVYIKQIKKENEDEVQSD